MTFLEFKDLVLSKTQNRTVIPPGVDLPNKTYTGLKFISRETIPYLLIVDSPSYDYQIMRKVDSVTYIRFPNKPILDTDIIDIDDALLDALALYVISGIEKEKANIYMSMFWTEIEANNDRLVEYALVEGSNDSEFQDASIMFA